LQRISLKSHIQEEAAGTIDEFEVKQSMPRIGLVDIAPKK
jgi:hypothetical protein